MVTAGTSPQIGRSKEIQLCKKCVTIIYQTDEFDACEHESINVVLTGFEHGTGVECMERGCAFNDVACSTDTLAGMLAGHARRHNTI